MQLKEKNLRELTQIINRDYGVFLNDEEAQRFGLSLLKITRIAMNVFNREEDHLMANITNH